MMPGIHARLEEVRKRAHLSRRAFARELEERTGYTVSHSSVGQYEAGTTVPSAYTAAVCRGFGVNPRWLLHGEGTRGHAEPSAAEEALAQIGEIVDEFR